MVDPRLAVVANAIGFVMLADRRPVTTTDEGVDKIDVSRDEAELCLRAAERVLDHLTQHDALRPSGPGTVELPRCEACAHGKHSGCEHPEYTNRNLCCCVEMIAQGGRTL